MPYVDLGRGLYKVALGGREQRVPDVEYQYRARGVGRIPRLVLDRVIEHPRLARQPLARRRADPEAASGRDDERQVHREARVGDAGMRGNPGIGVQDREKCRRRACLDPRAQRRGFEHPRGHRAARDVSGIYCALVPEEVGAPTARAVELAELIERHVWREVDVRLQSVAVGHQHAQQLGTDLIAGGFDRIEPRKLRALEELDRR